MRPNLAALGGYHRRTMEDAQVWRRSSTADGAGGKNVTWQRLPDDTPVKVGRGVGREQTTTGADLVEVVHPLTLPDPTHVRRGDRLVLADSRIIEVLHLINPTASSVTHGEGRIDHTDEPLGA